MRKSHISATIKVSIDVIYEYCRDKINSPQCCRGRVPYCAELVEGKTGGFID
jgi:hypothetical protein